MHCLLHIELPLVKAVDQYGWMMWHVLEMSRPYSTVLTVALVCITVDTTVTPVLFATKVSTARPQLVSMDAGIYYINRTCTV